MKPKKQKRLDKMKFNFGGDTGVDADYVREVPYAPLETPNLKDQIWNEIEKGMELWFLNRTIYVIKKFDTSIWIGDKYSNPDYFEVHCSKETYLLWNEAGIIRHKCCM